jgi:hypothetical protein
MLPCVDEQFVVGVYKSLSEETHAKYILEWTDPLPPPLLPISRKGNSIILSLSHTHACIVHGFRFTHQRLIAPLSLPIHHQTLSFIFTPILPRPQNQGFKPFLFGIFSLQSPGPFSLCIIFFQMQELNRFRLFSMASEPKESPANNPGLQATPDEATKGYFMQQTVISFHIFIYMLSTVLHVLYNLLYVCGILVADVSN